MVADILQDLFVDPDIVGTAACNFTSAVATQDQRIY